MTEVLDPPVVTRPVASVAPVLPGARRPGGRLRRLWRGRDDDPAWVRPTLLALLGGTAVLYLWGLASAGWGNSFYTAAVQAGSKSWKAFVYGSTDASNFITVDKTPASLWPAEIAVRIFGLNSWSVLAPQALEGVAAVGVLYLAIRRWFGPAAGLVAGAVLALTPVAALMFRYNNPDGLLMLCLVLGAYWLTRGIEDGRTRWVVLTGAALGVGFLAKELQAFLVIPGFAAAYLVAAPGSALRRIRQGAVMAVSMVAAAGWWIAIVVLVPATSRPYIGGSQNNSFWNVLFGYNGFGRLTGNETGSVGAGPGGPGAWGATGWNRMFNDQFGFEASWLLPAALLLLAIGLAVTLTRRRSDRTRAALLVWGGWLLTTAVAFSFGKGIIHEYYAVALAPAIGAVIGIGTYLLWTHRTSAWARAALIVVLGVTVWWLLRLLDRAPQWHPGWSNALVFLGTLVALGLSCVDRLGRAAAIVAVAGIALMLAVPAAASVTTVRTTHDGPLPTSGPAHAGARSGPGARGGPAIGNGARGFPGGFPGGGALGSGFPGGGGPAGGFPGGGFPGGGVTRPNAAGVGRGGVFSSPEPGAAVTSLLADAQGGGYRWAAASVGATNAAGFQIASGAPIMAIGGFNGSDPTPTLAEFERYVSNGDVHYFIASNFGVPGGGRSGTGTAISQWVQDNFTSRTVSGVTVYDLSSGRTHG